MSTNAIWTLQVDAKGVETGVGVEWLHKKMFFAGHLGMRITLKSDNEPSIVALKKALAIKRQCPTGLIESPVRESKSNGRVERAIRTWRDQYRTMRHYFEHRSKLTLHNNSPLSSWLVSWASEVINKYKVQDNGRTSYEMITGHRCKHIVVGFGERVDFQHTVVHKSGYRKDVGIFVGMMERSNSFLVANSEGVYASSHVMRQTGDQSYDAGMLAQVGVSIYEYLQGGVLQPPGIVAARGSIPANPNTDPVVPARGGYQPRRFRITKEDLMQHGYTPGCPACLSAQVGDGIRRGGHTEECRLRLEELMPEQKHKSDQRIAQGDVEKAEDDGDVPMAETGHEQTEQVQRAAVDEGTQMDEEPRPVVSGGDNSSAEAVPDDLLESKDTSKSERRFRTPERAPAVKRTLEIDDDMGTAAMRRRYGTPSDAGDMDLQDPVPVTPRSAWYADQESAMSSGDAAAAPEAVTDEDMLSLSEVDRKMLASMIMGADITEIYSPERVN